MTRQPTAAQLDQFMREVASLGKRKILDTDNVDLLNAKIAEEYAKQDPQTKFDFAADERNIIVLHNIDHDPEDTLKPYDPQAEREEIALNRLARKPKRKIRKPRL